MPHSSNYNIQTRYDIDHTTKLYIMENWTKVTFSGHYNQSLVSLYLKNNESDLNLTEHIDYEILYSSTLYGTAIGTSAFMTQTNIYFKDEDIAMIFKLRNNLSVWCTYN